MKNTAFKSKELEMLKAQESEDIILPGSRLENVGGKFKSDMDCIDYITDVLTQIYKHFCSLRSKGCLISNDKIKTDAESVLFEIKSGSTVTNNKFNTHDFNKYAQKRVVSILSYTGYSYDAVDLFLGIYNMIRNRLADILWDLNLVVDVRMYGSDEIRQVPIYSVLFTLFDIANDTETDMYLDDMMLEHGPEVFILDDDYDTVLTVDELGGKDVLDYIHSRQCIRAIYALACSSGRELYKYRETLFNQHKSCTMYELVDVLLNKSGKLAKLMNIGDTLSGNEDDQIIRKLLNHVSVSLDGTDNILWVDKVLCIGEEINMEIDPYSALAYLAKGNSLYDSLALSYLEWTKYFFKQKPEKINLMPRFVKAKMGGVGIETNETAYTPQKPEKINSKDIIQRFIKAKMEGVKIEPSEVSAVSKYIRDKLNKKEGTYRIE